MWRIALRKELRELWRDGRFRALAAIGSVLLLSSVLFGHHEAQAMHHERRDGQARSRAQWIAQGTKNPHTAAHYGVYVFREPSALAAFDRGLLSFSGASIFLEAHKQNLPVYAAAQDGTLARRLGEWGPAHVMQTLMPLLIVLLMFGSVAHERERGSLHMLRSMGLPLRTLAWGKLLAACLALGAALLPAALVGLSLGWVQDVARRDLLLRILGLALAYALYLGCFLAFCLMVSIRAKSARRALLWLLGLWAAWVIVIPRAITDAAGHVHPLPRWAEIEHKLTQEQGLAADSADPYARRIEALRRETLAKYGAKDPSELPINFGGIMLIASEDWGNDVFDRHFGQLYGVYRAQARLLETTGWLAPLLALRAVSMDLAGTGLEDDLAFRRAAEAYRRDLVYRMNKAVRDHPEDDFTADAALWRDVPPFDYARPSAVSVLRHHVEAFAALGVWLAIGLIGVLWTVRGLDREAVR